VPEAPSEQKKRRQFELWIETGVVLLVCVAPSLFSSIAAFYQPGRLYQNTFLYHAISSLFHSAVDAALVLFIIWRSRDPLASFGLRRFRFVPDVLGGIGVWAIGRGAVRLVWIILPLIIGHENYRYLLWHQSHPSYPPPSGGQEYALLAVYSLAVGFSEELLGRAYLITRLEELLDSKGLALLVSTVLFACLHVYQGDLGVIGAATFGLVQGIVFLLFRRLGPLVVAHGLQDFVAVMSRA
jgi:membrane protease YdiL (CAAX protease family)